MNRVTALAAATAIMCAACSPELTHSGSQPTDPESGQAVQALDNRATTTLTLNRGTEISIQRSLDDQYEACLLDLGFDPEGVQVLLDEAGKPWWVKTGHNVPADHHGSCFAAIGGEPNGLPSWG